MITYFLKDLMRVITIWLNKVLKDVLDKWLSLDLNIIVSNYLT